MCAYDAWLVCEQDRMLCGRARTPPGSFANEIAHCTAELVLGGLVRGRARVRPSSYAAKLARSRARMRPDLCHSVCSSTTPTRPCRRCATPAWSCRSCAPAWPRRSTTYSGMHAAGAYSARACAVTTYVLAASVLARMVCRHWCICLSLSLENQWWVEGRRYVRSGRHRAARAYEGGTPLRRYPRGKLWGSGHYRFADLVSTAVWIFWRFR